MSDENQTIAAVAAQPADCTGAYLRMNSGTALTKDGTVSFYLPRDDWNNSICLEPMGGRTDIKDCVTVINLGVNLIAEFRRELPRMLDPTKTSSETRATWLSSFGSLVGSTLPRHGIMSDFTRVCNIAVNEPGTKSTGQDFEKKGVRVGLHIDNHDRLPLSKRRDAVQLLTLNCSTAFRYFHFIDLPVSALAREAGILVDQPNEDLRQASNLLKDCFLAKFPDYPITRICLPPGFAYLATPQNMIHDGAGGSDTTPDIAFLMLGTYHRIAE